jgi:large subunit ribosomal protein L22
MADSYNAYLYGIRVSPRKARLVADMIRGKRVSAALDILKLKVKKTAPVLSKLVQSAIANAKQSATVDVDRLFIAEVYVDGGPMLKRFMPRAQGRAFTIRKRTSHFTVKLREK